jgi:hypothetical protein
MYEVILRKVMAVIPIRSANVDLGENLELSTEKLFYAIEVNI